MPGLALTCLQTQRVTTGLLLAVIDDDGDRFDHIADGLDADELRHVAAHLADSYINMLPAHGRREAVAAYARRIADMDDDGDDDQP